jgi:hypothetical protein
VTNVLAYYIGVLIKVVKSFVVQAPGERSFKKFAGTKSKKKLNTDSPPRVLSLSLTYSGEKERLLESVREERKKRE